MSENKHSQSPLPSMPPLGAHGQLYLVKEDDTRHQEDRRLKCRTEFAHERLLPTTAYCTLPRAMSQHRWSPTSHGRDLGSITVLWDVFFFFSRRYNSWWVLACFTISFHNLPSLHFSLRFLTFIFFKPSFTWSSCGMYDGKCIAERAFFKHFGFACLYHCTNQRFVTDHVTLASDGVINKKLNKKLSYVWVSNDLIH